MGSHVHIFINYSMNLIHVIAARVLDRSCKGSYPTAYPESSYRGCPGLLIFPRLEILIAFSTKDLR
jgi:hypothetical protein